MMTSEAGLLSPEEYQLIAAPALEAAAQAAAQRGDPHLYNDMASMLALLGLVNALIRLYRDAAGDAASPRSVLEAAPMAVCALVFTESGLGQNDVTACLRALAAAYVRLLKAGVLGPQEAYVEKAYTDLRAGRRAAALQALRQAALAMARAVDAWEADEAASEGP
jgi:hypothetical protein